VAKGKDNYQNSPQKKDQTDKIYEAPEKQYRDKKEDDLDIDEKQTEEFPARKESFEE
jgi:hypothetical protein